MKKVNKSFEVSYIKLYHFEVCKENRKIFFSMKFIFHYVNERLQFLNENGNITSHTFTTNTVEPLPLASNG